MIGPMAGKFNPKAQLLGCSPHGHWGYFKDVVSLYWANKLHTASQG